MPKTTKTSDITIWVDLPTDDETAPASLTRLARAMFDSYGEHCDWRTFDGRSMPTWDAITPAVRSHWRAAARRASYEVTSACKLAVGTAVAGELVYPVLPEAT